jgi:Kef-type K+ transport system membrane component KefB/nucleotide-binding universal stress UspA family protein
MNHLNEIQVLRFLIQFTLLFVSARMLADVMKRLGQATVIGELLAGILLGPTVLGHFAPALHRILFPPDAIVNHLIDGVAWLGVIMLLLMTGLETDLGLLKRVGRGALSISILGVLAPGAAGFALGWALPAIYLVKPDDRLIFSLFMAVAMAISAVPVIAKILMDFDLMRRDLGMTILAAGIIDDTLGWIALSVVAGLAAHGAVDLRSLGGTILAIVLFVGFCYYAGGALVLRLMRWVDDHAQAEHAGMSALVGVAMVCAIVTQAIGIHAVFGAYIAGLMIGRSARLHRLDRTDLEAATVGVFAPVFFGFSGLKADLFAIHQLWIAIAVLAIAVAGKLIGCALGSRLHGLGWRESLAVAIGMDARGGMGIIVGMIGLNMGVLGPEMYAIVIMVAMVTSLMTPPLLSWVLAGLEPGSEEMERFEREKMLARVPFTKEGAKLLVLSGGGPHARLAAHLAGVLGNHPDATITIFRATVAGSAAANPAAEEVAQNLAALKTIALQSGASNVITRTGSGDSAAEAILKESARGYDAIFVGASQNPGGDDDALAGEVLPRIVADAHAPIVIARDANGPIPLRRALAPTTGATFSRLGASLAMLYAHATGAMITALFVNEAPFTLRNFYRRANAEHDGAPIAEEIRKLGEPLGVAVDARVATGGRPERVILDVAARISADLLVIGVMRRPSNGHLNFGPKVDYILRNARCAIALAVTPDT